MKHCFTPSFLFTPHPLLLLLLLLALTLKPQAPKAQDTLAFYRFENNLLPEPGFPVQNALVFSGPTAYYTPSGYQGKAFHLLFGGNNLAGAFHSLDYVNVSLSMHIKNATSGIKSLEISYDTGTGFIPDTILNILTNSSFLQFQLPLPTYCWNHPGFSIRIAQTTASYWGNFFIDNLLLSGQYAEFSVDHILPTSGPPGTQVQIHGSGFLNLVNLKYGSDSLYYQVINDSLILLEIPAGATASAPFTLFGSATFQTPQPFDLVLNSGNCYTGTTLIISELCEPAYSTQNSNKYIEIFNPTPNPINLQGWYLQAYSNISNADQDTFTWNLSGQILPGQAMTCGAYDPGISVINHDFADPGWVGVSGTCAYNWNGQDRDGAALFRGNKIVDRIIKDSLNNSSGVFFANGVLVRNDTVCIPNRTTDTSEWTYIPNASFNAGDPPSTPKSHSVTCQASPFTWNAFPENDSVCEGEEMVFGLALDGGGYAIDYQWYLNMPGDTAWAAIVNGAGISGAQSDTLRIAQAGLQWADAQFYCEAVAASISCGVTSRAVRPILLPAPSASISNDTIVCTGSQVQLFASGGSAYQWSNGSNGDTVSVTPVSDGYYSVSVSNAFGCTSTDSVFVQVHPLPLISLSPDTSLCAGDSITLSAATLNAVSYLWSTQDSTQSIRVGSSPATYNLSVTDFNGCQADTSVSITEYPLPAVNFAYASTGVNHCIGQTIALTGTNAQTYFWNDSIQADTFYLLITGLQNIVHLVGTDANGCQKAKNFSVAGLALPPVALTAADDTLCAGQAAHLQASGASSYIWSANLSQGGTSKTAYPQSTTIYSVTGTGSNTCSASAQITITVHPLPILSLSGDTAICIGDSIQLAAGGAENYAWDQALGAGANHTVSPTQTTNYSVTGTDVNGCSQTDSVKVTVYSLPNVSINGGDSLCLGDSLTLTAQGAQSYVWDNMLGTGAGVIISPAANTSYSVTGTDGNGCSAMADILINVNPLPSVSLSASATTICEGDSSLLTAGGAATYTWNTLAGSTAIQFVSPANTTAYSVTGTDGNGCSAMADILINVNPLPNLSLSASQTSICKGDSSLLSASGANVYAWNSLAGSNANQLVSPSSNTAYSVTGTDGNGCSASADIIINVNPLPSVSLSASATTICEGDSSLLTAGGAASYAWNTLAGSNANQLVSPSSNTAYSVTGTDGNGCSASADIIINVNPLPSVSLSASATTICEGDSSLLTAGGAASYAWNTLAGSNANQLVSPSSNTAYSVTGTDGNGCSAMADILIIVNPLPNLSLSASPTSICEGDSSLLTAGGALTYAWNTLAGSNANQWVSPVNNTAYSVTGTDGNGCSASADIIINVNALPTVSLSASPTSICEGDSSLLTAGGATTFAWNTLAGSNANQWVSPVNNTAYSVTGTDGNGCSASADIIINVNALPTVSLSASPTSICEGDSSLLTAGGATTFAWNTLSGSNPNQWVSPASNTAYSVTGTDGNGCSAMADILLNVIPLPNVSISGGNSICLGDSLSLSAGGALSYQWNNGAASQGIVVQPNQTTTYTVTGTDAQGCQNTALLEIFVHPLPQLSLNLPPPFCIDDSVMLPQWASPGGGTYSGSGISQGSFDPMLAGAGTHLILYHYNDANACSADTSFTVEVEMRYRIGGHLLYDADPARPMPNPSLVRISSASPPYQDSSYLQNGAFRFSCLENGNYQLQTATDVAWGGSNASDALEAARFSVGLVTLSPLRRLAADVDLSGYVNAGDALYILNRFVGNISAFPRPDWVLPPQSHLLQGQHLDSLVLAALCAGDVNGSYQPLGSKSEERVSLAWERYAMREKEGSTANLPRIWVSSPREWGAISLRLRIDPPEAFGGLAPMLPDAVWQYENGELRFAAYSLEGQPCAQEYPLFFLHPASEMIRSIEVLSGTELADRAGAPLKEAGLVLGMPQETDSGLSLWPNPARDRVDIKIKGWEEGERVRWTLYHPSGQKVKAGMERNGTFMVSLAELVPGVYVISLDWGEGDATRTEHHRIVKTE